MKKTTIFISETAGKSKLYIIVLIIMKILLGASGVFYATLLRNIIDSAVSHNKDRMVTNSVIFVFLVAGQISVKAVIRFTEELTRSSCENSFKKKLFSDLLFGDYSRVTSKHSGEWLNRLTSDTVVVADGLANIIPGVAGMFTKMAGALIMILIIEPKFCFILIPGGALFIVLTYTFRRRLKKLHKQMQEKDGNVRIFLQEHLSSLVVLKVFGKEQNSLEYADLKMNEHRNARMSKNRFSNICNIGFGTVMNGAYVLGAVYSAFGIYNGTMSYGTFTALLQLISQIQSPFANITGYFPKYFAMTASAERLMEAQSYSNISDNVLTAEQSKEIYEKQLKSISFSNVSFSYESKEDFSPILDNISFDIKKGEYIAVTGTSGCGKSTMLKILMGLYHSQSGKTEAFLENGDKIPLDKLRRLFAYVPQGNYLMSGTIRDVVTFGQKSNEEDVINAINLACGEFVFKLPDGINTMLGEKGAGLSEGQMQRIAVARALYADRPVLILDEATSALDEKTEKQLLNNLKNLTDKSVFIVTHRPQVFSICEKQLLFTDNGIQIKELENNA